MKNKKNFWFIVAVASFAYTIFPEPSDLIPFVGWIDEGVAISIFWYALTQLGINFNIFKKKQDKVIEIK